MGPDVAAVTSATGSERLDLSDRRALARGGLLNFVGALTTGATGFAFTVIVIKALPRTEAGMVFAATSVFLIAATVARLGTATGVVYFVARLRSLGRYDQIG